ncbi:hypothetical protein [Erythrobacter oryzae]|uniref:hypothetical protein n=1 Tax=Erythrobacter oryzae TaxID=3019556 RepID=UPI00255649EA|nr:hypothetical protein [Erythrobacter sp. COR-2]
MIWIATRNICALLLPLRLGEKALGDNRLRIHESQAAIAAVIIFLQARGAVSLRAPGLDARDSLAFSPRHAMRAPSLGHRPGDSVREPLACTGHGV